LEKVLNEELNLGGQAEIIRREAIANSKEIDILRTEIYQLQSQLQAAYIRIKDLNTEIDKIKNRK